jgi:hypothetical protein
MPRTIQLFQMGGRGDRGLRDPDWPERRANGFVTAALNIAEPRVAAGARNQRYAHRRRA